MKPGYHQIYSRQVQQQHNGQIRLCRRILSVLIPLLCVTLLVHHQLAWLAKRSASRGPYNSLGTINETLGFEKVVVVSSGSSWRRDGLVEAAVRTGIRLEIPEQPRWTDNEVDVFRRADSDSNKSASGRGRAKCWLGHLNVIREILANGWSTSLIMEDDVDWDVMIKHQLSLVSPMIREVTNCTSSNSNSPYGDEWDLLWLGHCGETTPGSGPVVSQIDESLPESPIYRKSHYDFVYYPPQLRIVHITHMPICTFAYALTYQGASKIYRMALGGRPGVITGDLYRHCKDGDLRCVSVNPELFHHHKQAGELNSEIAAVEGWKTVARPADVTYTANIRYSARCNSKSRDLVTCQDPMTRQVGG